MSAGTFGEVSTILSEIEAVPKPSSSVNMERTKVPGENGEAKTACKRSIMVESKPKEVAEGSGLPAPSEGGITFTVGIVPKDLPTLLPDLRERFRWLGLAASSPGRENGDKGERGERARPRATTAADLLNISDALQ